MIIFLWSFVTVVFAIIYIFQLIHMNLIGLQLVVLLVLYLSFRESKRNNYVKIGGMNLEIIFVLTVLYLSHHTFTYVNSGDIEKIILIGTSFILAELIGIFWGYRFYKQQQKK